MRGDGGEPPGHRTEAITMRAHGGEEIHAFRRVAVVHADVTAGIDGIRFEAMPKGLPKSLDNPKADAVVVSGGGGVAGGGWWLVAAGWWVCGGW